MSITDFPTTIDEARPEYELLTRHIDEGWLALSETEAEHRNETALFGDSWPGAQLDIARSREALTASERRIHELEQAFPELKDPEPFTEPTIDTDTSEEPF